MQDVYKPCPCGSGKKIKFCCLQKIVGNDPREALKQAAAFPVYECGVMENWGDSGLASIYVVRQMPNLRYVYGMYIVDYYCLGLKNTFADANVKWERVKELKCRVEQQYALVNFPYEDARSLILGGIDYAKALGFEPNEDWKYSKYIVEYDRPYEAKFEFGKDGKPYYIQWPYDDVRTVMSKLRSQSAGYMLGGPA